MSDILVAGETVIDFLPDGEESLVDTETFHRRSGGAPANVAVGLSRLGRAPLFWTRLSTDPFGDHLASTLTENGVKPDLIERDPDAATTLAFVSLDPDADRAFSFRRDDTADTRLRPGTVDDGTLSKVEWVHTGGVTLADEPSRTATLDLMVRASRSGAIVSFDPNARPELFDGDDLVESHRRAIELADVVKATASDLVHTGILDEPAEEGGGLAGAICARGPHTALVTRGADGALARATTDAPWNTTGSAIVVEQPGYRVRPVDTTGAGDAFTAGAVRSLVAGESLADALAFANAVAARSTTETGAMSALPTRQEVERFREFRDVSNPSQG